MQAVLSGLRADRPNTPAGVDSPCALSGVHFPDVLAHWYELTRVVMQLRTDETPPIRLSACFDYSVSTCIWLSLPAQLGIDIAEFWTASAVFLADQANWSILRLADGQALSSFVGLGPGDAVPPDLDLTDMNIKSLSWSEVSTPTRPILLLVQNVLHMALIHQNDGTAIDSINKATTQMNNNIRHVRLHQDISVAAAGPVMSHIKSLRAALLMLKTVQLLLLIKLQMLLKVQAEAAQLRTLSIQRAVGALCQGILTVSSEASDRLNDAPGMQLTAAEKKEAELLSVLLVKMALPVMKQLLKDKILPSAFLHDWNCRLLISLLPRNSPTTFQAVAAEVTSSGVHCDSPELSLLSWTVLLPNHCCPLSPASGLRQSSHCHKQLCNCIR